MEKAVRLRISSLYSRRLQAGMRDKPLSKKSVLKYEEKYPYPMLRLESLFLLVLKPLKSVGFEIIWNIL